MSLFGDIEAFVETKIWPFVKNLGKAVVVAEANNLQPIAEQLVSGAEQAIVAAAASGSVAQLGGVLAGLVSNTAIEAEKAAITAGATAILASIGTALASNAVTSTKLAVGPGTVTAQTVVTP